MSAYWFSLASIYNGQTVDQVVTQLSPLGITLHAPMEQPYYYEDELGVVLKCIGEITVDAADGIDAWPHERLPEKHLRTLLSAAQEAFVHPPTQEHRWEHRHRENDDILWSCEVMVAKCDEPLSMGRLIARDHHVKADRISPRKQPAVKL